MKVLQINSVCGVKSTGRIATDIYHILKQQGHECKIAFGREEALNIDAEDAIKIGTDIDVKLHALMSRITDKTAFYSKKATNELIEKIKEYNPDVIHLHNLHGYYINIEILFDYLAKSNKKVVWTLHDCWALTGHCAHFDLIGCDKWKTGCYACLQKKEYPSSLICDASKENYKRKKEIFTNCKNMTIVTPSEWLANIVRKSHLGGYPIKVINNSIDLSKFVPTNGNFRKKHNIEEKKILLGVASRWSDKKGLNDFIKLAEIVGNEYKIVLVGVSEKQIKILPENILAIKRTNSIEELAEIYTTADVYVNPTKEEVFGLVNIEALACGTPVVTYNTGGSTECIDKTCGAVVPKNNVHALFEEVERICKNNTLSSEDCIVFAKRFDKNDKFMEYVKLYQEQEDVF